MTASLDTSFFNRLYREPQVGDTVGVITGTAAFGGFVLAVDGHWYKVENMITGEIGWYEKVMVVEPGRSLKAA